MQRSSAEPLTQTRTMDDTERPIVWLLSPYHSGSHRAWAVGYARHSRFRVELLTMPGRFWKWRMQGGVLELAAQARRLLDEGGAPQAVVATDMVHLPAWLGLVRRYLPAGTPVLLYMHENQLTYPWRPGERQDLTYAMINWLSQAAADRVLFNSRFHLESWFQALPNLLKHYPDFNHLALVEQVKSVSSVAPVGVACGRIARLLAEREAADSSATEPPLILWNQRWEYDKRPDRFFALLYRLDAAQLPFRLAVAGENFRRVPEEFEEARVKLADRIVHWGYVSRYADYVRLLGEADLVVSTADHEFFGISILEAVAAGAFPLLPNRLSYPELVPAQLHPACLYQDEEQLFELAQTRLSVPRPAPPSLYNHVHDTFDWPSVAAGYDGLLADLFPGIA